MKKLIGISLLSLFASFVFAGEATIPFWQTSKATSFTLNVSNVSDQPAIVYIEFYEADGSVYTSSHSGENGADINNEFTLQPHQTAWLWLNNQNATRRGYGIIRTKGVDGAKGKPFVVAHGKYDAYTSTNLARWMAVPINNGLPF